VTPLEKPSPRGDTGNEPVFSPAVPKRGKTRLCRQRNHRLLGVINTRGATGHRAAGILFRNLILRAFANLFDVVVYSRDWMSARDLVKSCSMEELHYGFGDDPPMVPRVCLEIPIARYQEEHPETNAEFLAGRNYLLQKVDANPDDPRLLSVLGLIDAYLGRKQEALQEGKRAMEMLPVSKDAVDAPALVDNLAANLRFIERARPSLSIVRDLNKNTWWRILRDS
jgi:hypothetical protein